MVTKKQIFDTMDRLEGKIEGTSFKNLQKELRRQGYKCSSTKRKFKCVRKLNKK